MTRGQFRENRTVMIVPSSEHTHRPLWMFSHGVGRITHAPLPRKGDDQLRGKVLVPRSENPAEHVACPKHY